MIAGATATEIAPSIQAREIEHLRQRLLPLFMGLAVALAWMWLGNILMSRIPLNPSIWPSLILIATGALDLCLYLRKSHYHLTCWTLLLAITLTVGIMSYLYPQTLAVTLGILAIIMAHALLGSLASLAALVLNVAIVLIALDRAGGAALLSEMGTQVALFYGVAWITTVLAGWPLTTSVEWALAGWSQARIALAQVQERRGELYRTVRALEEASRRIEQMNHELAAAQHEAELARHQKARFVATVSHELRGPLNMILGFSRMMALSPEQYGMPLPPAYCADVDAIYRNTQHLAALVDDILDLSQIEAKRLPLVKDRVELSADVIDRVVSIVQPLAERKGLDLLRDVPEDLPWVLADSVRLRQVLINLLTNAIRETAQGSVTVSAESQEQELVVRVMDTGPGIPPEGISKLFMPFQQLERKQDTGVQAGSGLGLNISKQFIELHGGQIWVESKVGRGTSFSFSLPLPGVNRAVSAALRSQPSPSRTTLHEVCLLMHQDPHIIRLLGRSLEGYRLVGCADWAYVGTLLDQLHPRALLVGPSDLAQAQRHIRASGYDVPIVSCTLPHADYGTLYPQVVGHLSKPLSPDVLLALMKQVEREGETTVLLVDDDPDAVRLMERVLTSLPRRYKTLRAYDGRRALEIMTTTQPDVLFLDLYMPLMGGEELLARMHADERLRTIPTIIVSAHDAIEGQLTVETPITLQTERALPLLRGVNCLRALLDAAQPHYLDQGANAPSLESASG